MHFFDKTEYNTLPAKKIAVILQEMSQESVRGFLAADRVPFTVTADRSAAPRIQNRPADDRDRFRKQDRFVCHKAADF